MYNELQTAVDKRWDSGEEFLGRDTRASMQSPCGPNSNPMATEKQPNCNLNYSPDPPILATRASMTWDFNSDNV
ncbi:hypothetical protein Y032_0023g712 [Ancylostoma ceylanicum]|uniref:Uncharacterized protein n=1 Tax=Ancylostoma ceylanicum TaxID=53326 RepID=A0A016UWG4_9BILA|nr:hypothetical protein Y032_0023g712 [Ancylostoma ceylanicum]